MTGENNKEHEKKLKADLEYAWKTWDADAIFLSECGEIQYGLHFDDWLALLRRILPDRFTSIHHESHYTSIVDENRLEILRGPHLRGPLTDLINHAYRMCQYLTVIRQNSADKPIAIVNLHCPA